MLSAWNISLIFIWTWLAFIALSYVESAVEGRNAWAKKSIGWKIKFSKHLSLTQYHFFLFWIMIPLLMTLPLVIYGWDLRLFGILASAYFSGIVIEDFFWFIVNPKVKFGEWRTNLTNYYPWIKLKNKKIIPLGYFLGILIALLSWYFIWRI